MNLCVVGLQWGDEGKGKVVDILAEQSDMVVRYNGGANAGHTVVVGDSRFALHLLPSGAVRPGTVCVIANGVVVDPAVLIGEMEALAAKGISLAGRLFISESAHVVLEYHKLEDKLREQSVGSEKIGTTGRGIGPCYADKVGRGYGIRMGDLRDLKDLGHKLQRIVEYKNKLLHGLYEAEPIDFRQVFDKCGFYAEKLVPCIADTARLLHQAIAGKKRILFEGAQGALLDLDHGTFPFVTSSNSTALGMPVGCGVPARLVDKFLGVVKAYTTRVGEGPFPTQLDDATGDYIREKGREYGTTTGRPRRCGWFDAVAVSYSVTIGGIDELAMMHLDTLGGLSELKVCKAYRIDGQQTAFFPSDIAKLSVVQCIYETVSGWKEDISGITDFADLPLAARDYVALAEKLIGRPIKIIGVGPERNRTIFRM
jgi:adenylosuccinate synthase